VLLKSGETSAQRAKEIVLERHGLSARDAVHVAVMERHAIETILSFDAGFDGVPDIKRIA
jgi:predicted nucleic acid-binding protein